jgi:hypothetical protein
VGNNILDSVIDESIRSGSRADERGSLTDSLVKYSDVEGHYFSLKTR